MINLAAKGSKYARETNHRYRSIYKRALYSLTLVVVVLLSGTIAFHYIEHYTYVDAFYFMSMLATAEGPAIIPATVAGKLLASFMAFLSIGSVIFALAFIFGPLMLELLRDSEKEIRKEEKIFKKDINKYEKGI
jgi:hypothetical protein